MAGTTGQLKAILTSEDVVQERLNNLEATLRDGLGRIEMQYMNLDKRLRDIETSSMTKIALQEQSVGALWRRLDDHESRLKEHSEFVGKLRPMYAALVWLSITTGGLIVAFLWAILTHQVEFLK